MGQEGCNNNGNVGSSRTFEEEIYWTNFKSMRFVLILSGDFLNQLMIPKKFSENMRDKLPPTIVLKGPGGATSKVTLVRENQNSLFFRDGWKEFANAHHFKENDLLVFKYKRDCCFKVWMFDKRNLCENAGSYFVRKSDSENKVVGESSQPKRKTREISVEIVADKEYSDFQGSESDWPSAGTSRRKGRRPSIRDSRKSDAEVKSPGIPCLLNRRLPSAEEKDKALQMAISESTNESFLVIMKASNVSQYYRLSIPAAWARNYLSRKNQDVELRAKEKKWPTRYNIHPRSGGGVIVSGWCNFVRDNSLQEFDVCLFKLHSQKNEPAIIDVVVFYAGEEAVNQPSGKLSPMKTP